MLAGTFFIGQMPNGQFDVAAVLLHSRIKSDLLLLLGTVGDILLGTHLRAVDGRLRAAKSYPHLLVPATGIEILIDRQYLGTLLFRQSENVLNDVELVHVFALVEQNLAIGVIDDTLLDNGTVDDVIDLLRHDNRLAEELAHRLE